MSDKKDNNPYSFSTSWEYAISDTAYRNYLDLNGNGAFDSEIDVSYNEMVTDDNNCRTGSLDGASYICEEIIKYVGNGEANDTGDPDNDGVMGEGKSSQNNKPKIHLVLQGGGSSGAYTMGALRRLLEERRLRQIRLDIEVLLANAPMVLQIGPSIDPHGPEH